MFPDRSSLYPPHLLEEREQVAETGTVREKIRYDLIGRPHYAFCMLAAADIATFFGYSKVTAIECGVAEGGGLLHMCELAELITGETGVAFEIYGFDTGEGLPALEDYRDHPEIWTQGDFPNPDKAGMEARLPDNAHMVWGNIKETAAPFLANLPKDAPIGFVSMDMDLYSSTRDALALYDGAPEQCLPVSVSYFDDTLGHPERIGSLMRNRWCGQLRAIDEFNEQHEMRKIDIIRTLRARRPLKEELWLEQIYGVHMLDHPLRAISSEARDALRLGEHRVTSSMEWLL